VIKILCKKNPKFISPLHISSVVLNKSPEEKNRSQHPNQKRRPIHNRVKVENQIAPEPVQVLKNIQFIKLPRNFFMNGKPF